MTGDSIKMELRDVTCPICKNVMYKNGLTTNGKYQRYLCKGCKKQWIEIQPEKPRVLRGHIRGYDDP